MFIIVCNYRITSVYCTGAFGIDWDELLNTIDDDSTVLVPETECPINYDHLSQSTLKLRVISYGIDIFFKTVELINNQLSSQ